MYKALFGVFLGGICAFAQPQYTPHDLGAGNFVFGINNSGQVVLCSTNSGQNRAYRTASNAAPNLITDDLGGFGGTDTCAFAINDSGQTAGSSLKATGERHAFRTGPNAPVNSSTDDLGTLGGYPTSAFGINASGQTTGDSSITGNTRAFRTGANVPINPATDNIGNLSPLSGRPSTGTSINTPGDVAGTIVTTQATIEPFVVHNGTAVLIADFENGISGGNISGINDSGQVAGSGSLGTTLKVWQNGSLTALFDCTLLAAGGHCYVNGINNPGQVVGRTFPCFHTCPAQSHAILFSQDRLYDLNDLLPANSGWVLNEAIAINDNGQIIGHGTLNGVGPRGFRLDPVCTTPSIADVSADPSEIWPPNNKMVPVSIAYTGSSSCPATFSLSVTGGDSTIVDEHNVMLLAAKDTVYTITITASNAAGTSTASVEVHVPHDQRK